MLVRGTLKTTTKQTDGPSTKRQVQESHRGEGVSDELKSLPSPRSRFEPELRRERIKRSDSSAFPGAASCYTSSGTVGLFLGGATQQLRRTHISYVLPSPGSIFFFCSSQGRTEGLSSPDSFHLAPLLVNFTRRFAESVSATARLGWFCCPPRRRPPHTKPSIPGADSSSSGVLQGQQNRPGPSSACPRVWFCCMSL